MDQPGVASPETGENNFFMAGLPTTGGPRGRICFSSVEVYYLVSWFFQPRNGNNLRGHTMEKVKSP